MNKFLEFIGKIGDKIKLVLPAIKTFVAKLFTGIKSVTSKVSTKTWEKILIVVGGIVGIASLIFNIKKQMDSNSGKQKPKKPIQEEKLHVDYTGPSDGTPNPKHNSDTNTKNTLGKLD